MERYSQLSARRKPELINSETYSLQNYHEAIKVTKEFENLLDEAEKINTQISTEYTDAYFELVLHPVKAFTNLMQLYTTVAQNRYAAAHFQINANMLADKVKELYLNDSLITVQYHQIANGKWNHMMDQTHIGYTYWQQPFVNKMPEVKYVSKDSAMPVILTVDSVSGIPQNLLPQNIRKPAFYETSGFVSIQAAHFTRSISPKNIQFQTLKNIGRDGDGITVFPVITTSEQLQKNNTTVEYEFYTYDSGTVKIQPYFSPTLNFLHSEEGLQYSIRVDEETAQIFSLNKEDNNTRIWEKWVADNTIVKASTHTLQRSGKHILKIRFYNPGIILQKIIIDCGGLLPSYLGPKETRLTK